MAVLPFEQSKLTDRYQTTVPTQVRRQLNLQKGDQITYQTDENGRVYIEASPKAEADPALGAFLDFLEADISRNPQRLQTIDQELLARMKSLVGDADIDLDAALNPDDE